MYEKIKVCSLNNGKVSMKIHIIKVVLFELWCKLIDLSTKVTIISNFELSFYDQQHKPNIKLSYFKNFTQNKVPTEIISTLLHKRI